MTKVESAKDLIGRLSMEFTRPAVLLSFGKDSMVLAHLIREVYGASHFPLPVIYHRDPWFAHKHQFANEIIQSWGLTVHDWPPTAAGVKVKSDMIELVARYNFGKSALDIPKNVCKPEDYPRRPYLCGLYDWVLRPKANVEKYPFDLVFHGHKSSDVDPFEGSVKLKVSCDFIGNVMLAFPLRHWTDDDVWDYIEEHHIPTQRPRYADREELDDKWHNNDYVHACTNCIDPRNNAETVFCPKLKKQVPNRGKQVLQINVKADYVNYSEV